MKRRASADLEERPTTKKVAVETNGSTQFCDGLLQQAEEYHHQYVTSEPYKHGVIQNLLVPQLLRNVRTEIQANLSFTPKETDIYKIHQSGDLANLDGLDDSSLKLLPSLLTLRDALYSPAFRAFLSTVTGAGPLSGKKTDMAINVYTPGCHLLCHDDVIGSRRVSYILYLTDPDRPWRPEWGGALRLYPTHIHETDNGTKVKVPSPDFSVSIPPVFNQLSFFAVQPGESFHDVEEVHAHNPGSKDDDDSRVRMAISGWYHIPQEGEDGYVAGLEESLAERSSLQQLQSSADQLDRPPSSKHLYKSSNAETAEAVTRSVSVLEQADEEPTLSETDFDFLLKYIAPTYLTPDTLDSVSDTFSDECSIWLGTFLGKKFSSSLRNFTLQEESQVLPTEVEAIESKTAWRVARPPHKQRFLYQQASDATNQHIHDSPIRDLMQNLLPSEAFRKWLQLATGLTLSSYDLCTRRFRRGKDYTLATGYSGEESQLEIILAITPSHGWGGDEDAAPDGKTNNNQQPRGTMENPTDDASTITNRDIEELTFGGYVAYMAGEDAEVDSNDGHSSDGVEVPQDLGTGARASRPSTKKRKPEKADAAVYKASADDEDDGVLFSMPACWNTLGLVLRDQGVMRFVKYVSQRAPGDRWDIVGEFGVIRDDEQSSAGDQSESQQNARPRLILEHEESETEIESSDEDEDDV
ncbi:MAG: hypothetical protein LQ343_001798 [Gyalolechia ehrenbergii]|nr:MAG: hypothetical protein LQ343_001798 [Gyalolechia ehrenbergii]